MIKSVKLVKPGAHSEQDVATIECANSPPWVVSFDSDQWGKRQFDGPDLFEAIIKLRDFLEPQGWLLLCNATRRNAFPSPLHRETTGAQKVYLHTMGQQARRHDLVGLLDPALLEEVSSVAEQKAHYQQWLQSLVEPPSPEVIAEAKKNPNGWVYKIKGGFGPNDAVPPEAILGAWKVDAEGLITGEFVPNPKYKPTQG